MAKGQIQATFQVDTSAAMGAMQDLISSMSNAELVAMAESHGDIFIKAAERALRSGRQKQDVSGELIRSLRFHVVKASGNKITFRLVALAPYARYVEYGTKPHTPPLSNIIAWAISIGKDEEAGRRIWASIRHHGTRPHPFLHKAVSKGRDPFAVAMRRDMVRISKRIAQRRRAQKHWIHRISIVSALRSMLYTTGRWLGHFESVGVDIQEVRSGVYGAARYLGDFSAIRGNTIANRLIHRTAGRAVTVGGGSSLARTIGIGQESQIAERVIRVEGGKIMGHKLRRIFGR